MKTVREVIGPALLPVLERLHRVEGASLFRYLADSPAYVSPQAGRWLPVLKAMGEASRVRLAVLAQWIDDGQGTASPAHYPSHFASLHYLSLHYLRGRLASDKQALVHAYLEAALAVAGDETSRVAHFIRQEAAVHQSDLAVLQALPTR